MMRSKFLFLGSISALTGVAMGALGAHALKNILSPDLLETFKTAVHYQLWHALGLLVIALMQMQQPAAKWLDWAGWLMFVGILLFSGSLYGLVLLNYHWLGMITPIGGVSFLSAWLCLMLYAIRHPS